MDLQEFSPTQDELPRFYMLVVTSDSDSNYLSALCNKNALKTRIGQWGLYQMSCNELTNTKGIYLPVHSSDKWKTSALEKYHVRRIA